ncbi:MAG: DUF3418 domain-containing protein, partial [Pirellulaceae bacterium]
RTAEQFQLCLRAGREEVPGVVQDVTRLLGPLFKNYHAVRLQVEGAPPVASAAVPDIQSQLQLLLGKSFLVATPWEWLKHLPRYLEAIHVRLGKLTHGGGVRDQQALGDLTPRWQALLARWRAAEERGAHHPDLVLFRWMFEELRVSLFAQQLGTSMPISLKRLDKQWEKIPVDA